MKTALFMVLSILIIFVVAYIAENTIMVNSENSENVITMEKSKEYLIENQYLSYNGMPTNQTFVMSHTGRSANNVYFDTNVKSFRLYNHNFQLLEINQQNITIELK